MTDTTKQALCQVRSRAKEIGCVWLSREGSQALDIVFVVVVAVVLLLSGFFFGWFF